MSPETAGNPELTEPRQRRVAGAGVELAVREWGDAASPTIVLVHGYPDTGAVWGEIVDRLRSRYHVVVYDVRGAGASSTPSGGGGFRFERLSEDLDAILEEVSPDGPAHLVGHDWGSMQIWDALAESRLRGRIASFTSISGPCLDHVGIWMQDRLGARPRALAQLAGQGARSWYIAGFQLPLAPALAWRTILGRRWPAILRRTEGIEPRHGHPAPTLAHDAAAGVGLYRQNVRRRLGRRRRIETEVPVQVVIPTRDAYVSPALFEDLDRYVPRLWRRRIRAGHWVVRSHPGPLARWIGELVDHAEGGAESRGLRRARAGHNHGPFEDRLVVVTGAGSGIGRATALAFAAAGAEVVCADVNAAAARETAHGADDLAGSGAAMTVDVGDADAMARFASAVESEHGVPDILVNNAGVGVAGSFLDTDLDAWNKVIDVNLWGVIHGSRLFARQMISEGRGGRIVNVASMAAFTPSRALPAYSTTKAAVLMLSECLRAELASEGIGVTAICPGVVDTNITRTTRFVGMDKGAQDRNRRAAARAYGIRGFTPDKVAREVLRAVSANAAVVPVTAEAKAAHALSRLSPRATRLLARANLTLR
jgi:NAD(P)-dependent dehydrogenase (short-subunit alcohol dehydrogenase family)/pimeloyl-ACP methyl ester carboxylesterase